MQGFRRHSSGFRIRKPFLTAAAVLRHSSPSAILVKSGKGMLMQAHHQMLLSPLALHPQSWDTAIPLPSISPHLCFPLSYHSIIFYLDYWNSSITSHFVSGVKLLFPTVTSVIFTKCQRHRVIFMVESVSVSSHTQLG